MKCLPKTIFSLCLILLANSASGLPRRDGIRGSKHDFSSKIWSEGEICIVCHVPHNSIDSVDAPLWNHTLTTQTFIPYNSKTMKAAVGQPDGYSKLCLSCHDGTVAIDSFSGYIGTSRIGNKMGPDLNKNGHWKHPISIVYDTNLAIADNRLNDPSQKTTMLGGTIQTKLLTNNKLQCTSCHDVHDTKSYGTMLRLPENNLCSTCHKN